MYRRKRTARGYRSKLEEQVIDNLRSRGVEAEYEPVRIPYTDIVRFYTPDLRLPNGILVEIKGWFQAKDRTKLCLVKAEHPDLDIRLLFSNARNTLSKRSKTTYAQWAETHGFPWAEKTIPKEWLNDA